MFVRGFLFDVFLDTPTPSSIRISCVENVYDDVGRVDNLVAFSIIDLIQT